MRTWYGAAGICINEQNELLMVLQGKPEERKSWSVPSGGLEKNETFEECCIREVEEETGYVVEIEKKVKIKKGMNCYDPIPYQVHYFLVSLTGGTKTIQDPDHLIYEIDWKSTEDLFNLLLTFPEDRSFLIELLNSVSL
ncbi:NUDIX hydrolase [Salirhabdus sp. Marseille-P4669]|uniref:NUDIX hydrolase n=1 Tax=Salirhabdus sp. Marseille-P4669 TaxID=2042310 RepID=UPI000C7970CF|nr:NUDIX hydrolase [Salirhabdus sp. Marseille-P4669]